MQTNFLPLSVCTNVTYDSEYEEARFNIYLGERRVAKYGVYALEDPEPACMPLMMPIPISMCLQPHTMGMVNSKLQMCMDVIVLVHKSKIMQMHFNCMALGADGLEYLNPDGEPVFPQGERNEDDDAYYNYVQVYK